MELSLQLVMHPPGFPYSATSDDNLLLYIKEGQVEKKFGQMNRGNRSRIHGIRSILLFERNHQTGEALDEVLKP